MAVGARFVKWGLGLFLFGVFLTFGIIGHYYVGARYPTGDEFMHNITLWFACPWTLSVAVLQVGGLGMVALGLTSLFIERAPNVARAESKLALPLCVVGLLGVFAIGYPGYFVIDSIWPGFYYLPITEGKNVWLLGQGLFIAVYFAGALAMFNAERHTLNAISA